VSGKLVHGTDLEIFESLRMHPGTLSCKPYTSMNVCRSGLLKPPAYFQKEDKGDRSRQNDPSWVESRGGHNKEQETWFQKRMLGYPRQAEEELKETKAPLLGRASMISMDRFAFWKEFNHEPTWDRNLWSPNWSREYRYLCEMHEGRRLSHQMILGKPDYFDEFTCLNTSTFCDNTGVTGDSEDDFGQNNGISSYRSFCLRVYVVGLEEAFIQEFGHPPSVDMNKWGNNRTAERRAYWVVTGRPHDDPAPKHPPFLLNWEDSLSECEGHFEDRRDLSTAVIFPDHMQAPTTCLDQT
jgi:hypothetical protein